LNLSSSLNGAPFGLVITGAILSSFLITYYAIPTIVKVSKYKGLMALPNSRTSHIQPTPNLGGIAIFSGFIVASVIFSFFYDAAILKYVLCGMTILLFIGLKDDILILDPKKKIMGQLVASFIIVVLGDLRITHFHNVFGIGELPYLVSISFTVLLFVFIIISFNFIDGIDGLASGLGILVSLFYAVWFLLTGHRAEALLCFELAAALLAFYRFNVFSKDTKIFMGDAGAMITGLLISVFTVQFIEFEKSSSCTYHFISAPALAISLLIVPMLDTVRVLALRMHAGKLFQGGRNHVHHLFLKLTNSHLTASLLIILWNTVMVFIAILIQPMGNIPIVIFLTCLTILMYIIIIQLVRRYGKRDTSLADH
jgi:UDP-GlcNAc:undecaprenyl-phosphate/decaprenyl-phosphate GlcNAc-1-phosphate transferase